VTKDDFWAGVMRQCILPRSRFQVISLTQACYCGFFDSVANLGGEFKILDTEFGKTKEDKGRAIIQVGADTCEELDEILSRVRELGAEVLDENHAELAMVEQDGVCPDGFYASTNIETYVCVDGQWVPVDDIEMDCAIVVDARKRTARCCPIAQVVRGQHVVVGACGIRVASMASSPGDRSLFFQWAAMFRANGPRLWS